MSYGICFHLPRILLHSVVLRGLFLSHSSNVYTVHNYITYFEFHSLITKAAFGVIKFSLRVSSARVIKYYHMSSTEIFEGI